MPNNKNTPVSSGNGISANTEHPRKKSKTAITVNVVMFMLVAFFVITVVSQLVTRFYIPLKTETAYYYENVDSVLFNGVYIRNEKQVAFDEFARYSDSGVIGYTNKCGSKVSINSVIAVAYSGEDYVYIRQRIAELKEQIDILSDAKRFAGTTNPGNRSDNSQLDAFEGQLSDTHLRILRCIASGDYEEASAYRNDYLGLQSKIAVSKNVGGDGLEVFDRRISELTSQISALEAQLSGSSGVLKEFTAPDSGYFVSNADGYEDILKFDDALNITREQIEDITANPSLETGNNVAGKVIYDYKWRMAAVVPTAQTQAISNGMTVNLRIGAYPYAVPVKVVGEVKHDDGNTLFIFECELLNEEFVQKRVVGARLLLEDYSGIRLPRSAIKYNEDREMGVYVKDGAILYFRKVKMLRSEEGFVIVENTPDEGYLRLFDNVVVRGRNLYDNKIVSYG